MTGIRMTRPLVEVTIVESEALQEEVNRFDPHLVIRILPIPANAASDRRAWIDISPYPDEPSRIRVEGRYWETAPFTLDELLATVDEVEGNVGESSSENSGSGELYR